MSAGSTSSVSDSSAASGGRIAIAFYSDDDFERLYELLIRAGPGAGRGEER